jgi:hypothetical protein
VKKYFILSGAFLFVAGAAWGVWKFEVYKKFPELRNRFPASVEQGQEMADQSVEPEIKIEEKSEKNEGEAQSEFKVKLQKVEQKLHVVKSKPPIEPMVKKSAAVDIYQKSHQTAEVKVAKSQVEDKNSVKHMVTKDETAWFLANVYYGKGQKYQDILAANGFSDPQEVKEGREIIIPNPKYHKGQEDFAARYSQVWEKRAQALKERNKSVDAAQYLIKAPMPSSKVVLPTDKIRAKDKTSNDPFTEVRSPHKSPSEMAKEVLRQSGIPQE